MDRQARLCVEIYAKDGSLWGLQWLDPDHAKQYEDWLLFMMSKQRQVAQTAVCRGVMVSTVFTGVGTKVSPNEYWPYETLIMGGSQDGVLFLSPFRGEAEKRHHEVVEDVRKREGVVERFQRVGRWSW